ncbi:MAG: hypothetical protein B7Z55_01500 [Planctomycetales bacterium 12-60-4]|nr:MAG: hypothetical protein B7Z55_01500 [Planctomycetales bacterium 12-60-4]
MVVAASTRLEADSTAMTHVVPPRFLFRWSFPVPYCAEWPGSDREGRQLPVACRLQQLDEFDAGSRFADLYVGWNEAGFGVGVEVRGKQQPLQTDLMKPTESDGLQVWIDTRSTLNVHRATKYCHYYCLLPGGDGKQRRQPVAVQRPLAQAREETGARTGKLVMTSELRDDGYRLDCWFPGESLFGFDPANNPRLGFYAVVKDAELGEQFLTVGREFPFEFDPSIWQTLELVR